jgi:hypothetical protein
MLVLVILSGAKDLKFYSEHAQGNKSEMFRFAQPNKPQLTLPWQPADSGDLKGPVRNHQLMFVILTKALSFRLEWRNLAC